MMHSEAAQLLAAGAALEDLAPEEWREYEAHRRACAACAALEVDLDRVLADLALAIPERMPPPDLLDGIRRAIAADPTPAEPAAAPWIAQIASTGPARQAAPRPASTAQERIDPVVVAMPGARSVAMAARPDRRPLFAALGLAAVLGAVAVGLGARSAGLSQELDVARSQVVDLRTAMNAQGAAMAVAIDPAHQTAVLHAEPIAAEATAFVVFVPGTNDAYLVAHGLPATPDGHGYQLWFADDAGVHGLGTYAFDGEGAFVAPFDVDLASGTAAMLTLEPTGGAAGDPGPQVVFGEL